MAVIGKDGDFDPSHSSREKTDAELGHSSHNSVVGTKVVDKTRTMTEDSDDPAESRLNNVAHNKGSFLDRVMHRNNGGEGNDGGEVKADKGSHLPGRSQSDGSLGEGNVPPEEDTNNEGSKALEGVTKFVAKKILHLFLSLGLPGFIIFFIIFGALAIISVVEKIDIFNFGGEHFDTAIEDNPKLGSYKDALSEAVSIYEGRSGCKIDIDYVHYVLYYPYFDKDDDYEYMEDNILDVLDLFTEGTSCPATQINYERNGSLYYKLLGSEYLKNYYLQGLGNPQEFDMNDAIEEVFDAAETSNEFEEERTKQNNDVLSSKSLVTIKETGKEYTIKEYLENAVYAKMSELNLPIESSNLELMKAYTVVFNSEFVHVSNFMGEGTKFEVDSGRIKACNMNQGCYQVISPQGSHYYVDGADGSGAYTYQSLDTTKKTIIKNAVSAAYGYVIVNKSDKSYYYPDTKTLRNIGNFTSIIYDSYPSARYTLINIAEPGYSGYVTFGETGKKKINTIVYKQTDYNDTFCGVSGSTIKTSGCGVTAMAMVVSTYKNSSIYNPVYMMTQAATGFTRKYCGKGISGTLGSFFKAEGAVHGYTTRVVYPNSDGLNNVMTALFNNTFVIVRIGPYHYTSGGHYMVLSGIDTTGDEVLVYVDDPNNDYNVTKPGRKASGWVSLNDIIAKEAFEFYIISR